MKLTLPVPVVAVLVLGDVLEVPVHRFDDTNQVIALVIRKFWRM